MTDQLTTCEPWGLTALNGTPPYTVYLTAVGSDTITVVKMGDTDNTLIYPNRVEPNTAVIGTYNSRKNCLASSLKSSLQPLSEIRK